VHRSGVPGFALAERGGVLITRPEPAASQMARALADQGWPCLVAPMLRIEIGPELPAPRRAQAVLVTSANALLALGQIDRALPLLAVGDATAGRALEAGFTNVMSAGRDAVALAELATGQLLPPAGPLLLASGAGQGMALAQDLRTRGFIVRRRIAYRSRPERSLPPLVLSGLQRGEIQHAMFFSAETARAFVRCIKSHALKHDLAECLAQISALAISDQTAHALRALPWHGIRVASHPNQDELVGLLS
jgi:uroporphyrinogen-III synthase